MTGAKVIVSELDIVNGGDGCGRTVERVFTVAVDEFGGKNVALVDEFGGKNVALVDEFGGKNVALVDEFGGKNVALVDVVELINVSVRVEGIGAGV